MRQPNGDLPWDGVIVDMVRLDLQTRGLTVDAILAAVRADRNSGGLPVMMLSADSTTHRWERTLESGTNAYLTELFAVAEPLEKIDGLSDGPSSN